MASPQVTPAAQESAKIARPPRSLASRIALWFLVFFVSIAGTLFVVSFFLDGYIRPRIAARMNSSLKGYHLTLGHAHIQLLNLRLTLSNMVITQDAYPTPPVADFPRIVFRIHWRELLTRHVVANVGIWNPNIHVLHAQAAAEVHNKTPLKQQGWQDALQNAYPFKINRLVIHDGDVTYRDSPKDKPLHLAHINFVTDNIRNIEAPNDTYPSTFSGKMQVFDRGELNLDGKLNYLMKPFPGMRAQYDVSDVPLRALKPATERINLVLNGGEFSSRGSVEYSPFVTNVDTKLAAIDRANITYVHKRATERAEENRVTTAGNAVEKENNRRAVNIKLDEVAIRQSHLVFDNEAASPAYSLYLDNTNLTITNLNNHANQGLSHVNLTGSFMGNGATRIDGTLVAAGGGPEFNTNLQVLNADLTSLNPVLQATNRVDVASGHLTVYAQLGVKNDQMTGYVKPMFSDVKVYDYQKDKGRPVLQQAKEMAIGAAAHILKNHSTEKVATRVDLTGTLKNPNTDDWQAFVEVLKNAFIQAILPGFDREVSASGGKAPAASPNR
ncbi:MAG TPA: DUF748 domain-containing protein [Candidatus Binataceae bacterium]|nr:DUF748 domain-containing protein [Candidatus Binataceae bacterium]